MKKQLLFVVTAMFYNEASGEMKFDSGKYIVVKSECPAGYEPTDEYKVAMDDACPASYEEAQKTLSGTIESLEDDTGYFNASC